MKSKNLPIGRQDFKTIIEDNCVYVDKTKHIYNLIASTDKFYFLSRPRRFGKSLLVTTLKYLFRGERALFKNLYIDSTDWAFESHPVIDLYFNDLPYSVVGVSKAIAERLTEVAHSYGVDVYHDHNGKFLQLLLISLYEKFGKKSVILIDEYDKPITDYITDLPQAQHNRDALRDFYSVLKSSDEYIRLFFMTGVGKFSQMSIFSQLNNLIDLTLDSDYATLTGFTQDELKRDFGYYIDRAQEEFNGTLWEKLRDKYNGFSWNGKDFVYNPFSYLKFLRSRCLDNFWFESGDPKFLADLLRQENRELEKIGNQVASRMTLLSFNIEKIDVVGLMFQTGYLTIKEKLDGGMYRIDFPNKEVNEWFTHSLLTTYADVSSSTTDRERMRMRTALQEGRFDDFIDGVRVLFASIPYQLIHKKESYFHTIFHMICHLLGFDIDCEVSVSTGRADAVVKTQKQIYIIEFKTSATPETAIKQIRDNKYADKFAGDAREIVLAGICFDTQKKELAYKVETP